MKFIIVGKSLSAMSVKEKFQYNLLYKSLESYDLFLCLYENKFPQIFDMKTS